MSELYEIESDPPKPALPGSVIVRPDADRLIDAVAADLLIHAHNCVRAFGDFHLALSGGTTPIGLYQRLMIDPNYRDLPWGRTHLWIVDERRVPFDDSRSNFRVINEIIGDHSGIPSNQVHPIFAMADDADVQYQQTLRDTLGWRERGHDRLDFTLLGMGTDAHTASLFPGSPALIESLQATEEQRRDGAVALVRINAGPSVTPPDRVTMTLPLINASRFIAVLVTGESKRSTISKIISRAAKPSVEDVIQLPILGVRPLGGGGDSGGGSGGGELRWFLDYSACPSSLPTENP